MYTLAASGGHGIFLPDVGLSLDNSHPKAELVFISHAHADHLPRNRSCSVVTSRATLALMRLRGFKGDAMVLPFGERRELETCAITLYPAGHILGSSMILVESDRGSLLYTGDLRTPPSPASEGFTSPEQVDELIIEATFGLPIYRWRHPEELAAEVRTFASDSLSAGQTPIFLAYNLGKAQEIMHILSPLGHPMQVHGGGYPLCAVYEQEGFDLGQVERYERSSSEGKILIAPGSALATGFASHISKKRVAWCSGWAAVESRRIQAGVDVAIPLSDHLDFFELISLCKRLSPKKIHITHTPSPAVVEHFLRAEGLDASFLNLDRHDEEPDAGAGGAETDDAGAVVGDAGAGRAGEGDGD